MQRKKSKYDERFREYTGDARFAFKLLMNYCFVGKLLKLLISYVKIEKVVVY